MFLPAGSIAPYLIYIFCIWGFFLLNSCINIFFQKENTTSFVSHKNIEFEEANHTFGAVLVVEFNKSVEAGQVKKVIKDICFEDTPHKVPVYSEPLLMRITCNCISLRAPPVSA
ncbi:MAG: hypothetical protein HC906_16155 [Bacteroidales bacterium]|nr:hypothetical protein [Bacteroidales bacterium]